MKKISVIVPVVLLGLVAVACSNKGLSLQDYYMKLAAVQNQMETTLAATESEMARNMQAAKGDIEKISIFKETLLQEVAAVRAAANALRGIDAPSEVEQANADFVAAIDATNGSLENVLATFDKLKTMQAVQEALTSETIQASAQKIDVACRQLQKTADDNEIKISLSCGGGPTSPSQDSPAPPIPASPGAPLPTYGPAP